MYTYVKRGLDVLLSLCAIVVLSPVLLLTAAAIALDDGFPVLFVQQRVGRRKRLFGMFKFRTMRRDAPHDMPTHLFPDQHAFLTRTGRFLRRTSLDELPQLFHVLSGKMSLIGPRPALWNQDDLIAARDQYQDTEGRTINDLRPGLTGWAQINGRDELSIEEKASLDGEYLHRLSLRMDVLCLLRTVSYVLRARGVRG